jgi:hypothetical protein
MDAISKAYHGPATASIDGGIQTLLNEAETGVRRGYQACGQHIREAPMGSVLGAMAAGYCMHQLPLRALVMANVRLIAALVPPALFFYGAAKVYELLQRQQAPQDEVGFHPMEGDD